MANRPLIVGIGGTLRDKSRTLAAVQEALRLAEASGADTELLDLQTLNLPMYIPYLPVEDYPSPQRESIQHFLDTVRRANTIIWSSPTYHGTVSGIFKNALDMLEILSDDTPPYLAAKAVGLIAVADARTLSAMVDAVNELRAWLAPSQVLLAKTDFDDDRQLIPGRPTRKLQRLIDELIEFSHWRHLANLGPELTNGTHED